MRPQCARATGYRRAMQRVCAGLAGMGVVLALAACGGGPTTKSTDIPTVADQATPSTSAKASDKAVGPAPSDREVHGLTGFVSPTGNVSCMVDADFARCDIIDRDWSPPPRPADCEFDYGQGISLAPGEQAQFVCAGDTAFGPDEVLSLIHI